MTSATEVGATASGEGRQAGAAPVALDAGGVATATVVEGAARATEARAVVASGGEGQAAGPALATSAAAAVASAESGGGRWGGGQTEEGEIVDEFWGEAEKEGEEQPEQQVRSRARGKMWPRKEGTVAHTVAYYPLNFVWAGTDPVEAVRRRAEGLGCKGEVAEGPIVVVTNRLLIDGARRTQEIRLGGVVTYDDQIMTGVWAGIGGRRQYLRLGRGGIAV
jgi:hypothetical protein